MIYTAPEPRSALLSIATPTHATVDVLAGSDHDGFCNPWAVVTLHAADATPVAYTMISATPDQDLWLAGMDAALDGMGIRRTADWREVVAEGPAWKATAAVQGMPGHPW